MHTKTQAKQLVITITLPRSKKRLTTVSFFYLKLGGIIMAFVIKVKKKDVEIKFNYRLNFKANKKLGTKNEQGVPQNDGAGILFVQVLEKEDDALINLIKLVDDKLSENEILDAVDSYVAALVEDGLGEEEAYDQVFEDLKEEMLSSGFFVSKVRKYHEQLMTAQEVLGAKTDEESQVTAKALGDLAQRVKSELSSLTVQDKD